MEKKDRKGNLITNHLGLKNLYLKTYKQRLRNRPIQTGFKEIENLKSILFNLRNKLCEGRKSDPWKMEHLENAIKTLKKNKARDPNGWINELFRKDVAGNNLKLSMLKLFNKIKTENFIPTFMRKADITTLYKGKGSKTDLENERGIFIVSIFRSLLMKLIYHDIYEIIDISISDSQIGSRKGKNIRNHVWVLNSIINETLTSKKKHPIDVQIYDYKQCFDGLWLKECLNDMYSGGLKDNKFNTIYNANSDVKIVVKTPVGKSNEEDIQNVVIQGDVFGPILCSKQIDTFGKECLEEKKYNYLYKGEVEIPPLSMVDDIICVSVCGFQSVMLNSYLTCKTNMKKLQFGAEKCKKMDIGMKHEEFHSIFVDKWREIEKKNNVGKEIIEDVCVGKVQMEESEEEKYLGDIITKDGKNIKNIQSRINKGKGIVKRITEILDGVPFGKLYFQVAIILRNSLLVSSVLCNSETWFNLTKSELELLETVDLQLLRTILGAPKTVPKEMLYLELGVIPLREMIRQRRLNFLYYILTQDKEAILFRVFEAQKNNRNRKDWVTSVTQDLEELELDVSFETIQEMGKEKWRNTVRNTIQLKSFRKLEKIKETHSKVKNIKHSRLEMQDYLMPNDVEKMTKDEVQMIFKIRCRSLNLKMNMKNQYETFTCMVCLIEDETQSHVYECKEIFKLNNNKQIEIPKYEEIFNGNVHQKVIIARILKENLKIRDSKIS